MFKYLLGSMGMCDKNIPTLEGKSSDFRVQDALVFTVRDDAFQHSEMAAGSMLDPYNGGFSSIKDVNTVIHGEPISCKDATMTFYGESISCGVDSSDMDLVSLETLREYGEWYKTSIESKWGKRMHVIYALLPKDFRPYTGVRHIFWEPSSFEELKQSVM